MQEHIDLHLNDDFLTMHTHHTFGRPFRASAMPFGIHLDCTSLHIDESADFAHVWLLQAFTVNLKNKTVAPTTREAPCDSQKLSLFGQSDTPIMENV